MTYTIGDERITLEYDKLDEAHKQLITSHSKLFRYCLNNAIFKLLINLKNSIHLFGDSITIYATLLRKIPGYDDATTMAARTETDVHNLETKFKSIFGGYDNDCIELANKWQTKSYDSVIQPLTQKLLSTALHTFQKLHTTLFSIEFFFEKFDNLQKLVIPYLSVQADGVIRAIKKSLYLVELSTICDNLSSIKTITPEIIKQLKKIEKITSGVEKESKILEVGFKSFDPSLQQYTKYILGKAIMKKTIGTGDLQVVKRRNICYEATDYVISIPVSEASPEKMMVSMFKVILVLAMVAIVVVYRLGSIVVGSS